MSDLMKPQLEVIRERMNRATPGPWGWFGNTGFHGIYLATQRWGRHMVMTFERWGMQNAQPAFWDRPNPSEVRQSIVADGKVRKASEVPIYEVAPNARDRHDPAVYREDLIGLRNADAQFIAHSRADVEWLIGEVDRLNTVIADGTPTPEGKTLRVIGWSCEHNWNTPSEGQHTEWDRRKQKPVKDRNVFASFERIGLPDHYRCEYAVPVYVLEEAVA